VHHDRSANKAQSFPLCFPTSEQADTRPISNSVRVHLFSVFVVINLNPFPFHVSALSYLHM